MEKFEFQGYENEKELTQQELFEELIEDMYYGTKQQPKGFLFEAQESEAI